MKKKIKYNDLEGFIYIPPTNAEPKFIPVTLNVKLKEFCVVIDPEDVIFLGLDGKEEVNEPTS